MPLLLPIADLTCSDLQLMGSGVTSLSTSDLGVADDAFLSCAEFLGQQTGWSDAQKSALATVAKRSTVCI